MYALSDTISIVSVRHCEVVWSSCRSSDYSPRDLERSSTSPIIQGRSAQQCPTVRANKFLHQRETRLGGLSRAKILQQIDAALFFGATTPCISRCASKLRLSFIEVLHFPKWKLSSPCSSLFLLRQTNRAFASVCFRDITVPNIAPRTSKRATSADRHDIIRMHDSLEAAAFRSFKLWSFNRYKNGRLWK